MQNGEQSHPECQLISPLDYVFCQLYNSLANTCVCDMACIHMGCTTELSEASHMQRLLQNGNPNPGNFVRVIRTVPQPGVMYPP